MQGYRLPHSGNLENTASFKVKLTLECSIGTLPGLAKFILALAGAVEHD